LSAFGKVIAEITMVRIFGSQCIVCLCLRPRYLLVGETRKRREPAACQE